jgi:clan AA aspartic protease
MISDIVTELLEATISVEVRTDDAQSHQITAVIDTGFSGDLTLPQSLVDSLHLEWLCRQQGMLADGSLHTFDVYIGKVLWNGRDRTIEIEVADIEPLLGMSLLEGNCRTLEVRKGGKVTIDEGA